MDDYVQYGMRLLSGLSGKARLADVLVWLVHVPVYHGATIGGGVPGHGIRRDVLTG
jgi:hypothetical protein